MSRRASLISQQNSVTDGSALLVSNLIHVICFFRASVCEICSLLQELTVFD